MTEILKSNEIWEKIKNIKISLYGLTPKPISEFVEPKLNLPTEGLYVKPNTAGAILPALEMALKEEYSVNYVERGWLEIKELAPKVKLS